ncbi:hypothetical protein [Streptomyces sp. NPDC057552]|uniref:hypothetical protein n=1 Tax=Streptomyces sp. NPDC057552 TaxID=3350537 RepID=UPI00369E6037
MLRRHIGRAVFSVGGLAAGRPGPVAEASWAALASIAAARREDPELPGRVGELLPVEPC